MASSPATMGKWPARRCPPRPGIVADAADRPPGEPAWRGISHQQAGAAGLPARRLGEDEGCQPPVRQADDGAGRKVPAGRADRGSVGIRQGRHGRARRRLRDGAAAIDRAQADECVAPACKVGGERASAGVPMALILGMGQAVDAPAVVGPGGADPGGAIRLVVGGRRVRIPTGLINRHTDRGEPVQVRPDQGAAARIAGQEVDAFRSVPQARAGASDVAAAPQRGVRRSTTVTGGPVTVITRSGIPLAASARPLQHGSPASTSHGPRLCRSSHPARARGAATKWRICEARRLFPRGPL